MNLQLKIYIVSTILFFIAMSQITNGDDIIQPIEVIKAIITASVYFWIAYESKRMKKGSTQEHTDAVR